MAAMIDDYEPVGARERFFAEQFAATAWQLQRATTYEEEKLAARQASAVQDAGRLAGLVPDQDDLGRYTIEDAEAELESATRNIKYLERVMHGGYLAVTKCRELFILIQNALYAAAHSHERVDMLKCTLPMAPFIDGRMREEIIRSQLQPFSNLLLESFGSDDMLTALLSFARQEEDRCRSIVANFYAHLGRLHRERLILDVRTRDNLDRHVAHHTRNLFRYHHELEALQTQRLGGQAPLARLDVHGAELLLDAAESRLEEPTDTQAVVQ